MSASAPRSCEHNKHEQRAQQARAASTSRYSTNLPAEDAVVAPALRDSHHHTCSAARPVVTFYKPRSLLQRPACV